MLEEQKKKLAKDIDVLQHKLDELQMAHEKLDKSKRKLQSEVQQLFVSFLLTIHTINAVFTIRNI